MLNGETAWAQLKCWSWNYLKLFEIRPSRGLHPISPWVSSVLLSESWRQDFQWGLGQKASWKAMLKTWQDTWEFHSLHLYSVQSLLSFRIYVYQATIYEEPQMAFHMPQRWVFQGLRPSDMSWFMCSSVQPGCTRLISVPFPACLLACRRSLHRCIDGTVNQTSKIWKLPLNFRTSPRHFAGNCIHQLVQNVVDMPWQQTTLFEHG